MDISSLVVFRVVFALIMLVDVYRYLENGWIAEYWLDPPNHFGYWPFDFLKPLAGDGMYALFYLMGALSLFILVGFLYRISMALFFLCFSYTFLLEQSRYLNHFYLVILVSFVLIWVPAHRSLSIDSRLFPRIRSELAPAWSLWLVRFMIGVPYFFGGIAKLNADWLQGEPLRMWLAEDTHVPLIGPFLTENWMVMFMSYAGLLLDLLIVPALLWRRTRMVGFLLIGLFHITNWQLFNIGIFPWFMLLATTIYFDPNWPRRLVNRLGGGTPIWPLVIRKRDVLEGPKCLNTPQKVIVIALAAWVAIQVLVPLRHFAIPGNVHWTEEGHRYAWHMKLRTKHGEGTFTITDKASGASKPVDVDMFLLAEQKEDMMGRPYLIWQFAQMLKAEYKKLGFDIAVYADIKATLNGRKFQQFTDPKVDLAQEPRPWIPPTKWIYPLETPLSDRLPGLR